MSSVQVFHNAANGALTLVGVYDGDRIKAHSAKLRNMMTAMPSAAIYRINLYEGDVNSLQYALGEIQAMQQGQYLEITTTTRDLNKAIALHNAIEFLEIEPEQSKIVGHLNGYIAHQLISPEEMIAIHKNYGTPGHPHARIWNTMIHTIAYRYVGKKIKRETAELFSIALLRYPELKKALDDKVREFEDRQESKAKTMEKRAAKKASKKTAKGKK